MNKHTPGPWTKVPQSDGSMLIARRYETGKQMNPTGLRLVGFTMARKDSLAEDEANASLIAAAPDLLAELQNIANANPHEWDEETRDQFQQWAQSRARFAIAKAEGTS